MLAEIFMLRLEAMAREAAADNPTSSGSHTQFVPIPAAVLISPLGPRPETTSGLAHGPINQPSAV
jgi:hypothetical protein